MVALLIGFPSGGEIIVVLIVFILFFGAKRIPELAKGLGQGLKEFRKASNDIKKEIEDSSRDIENSINTSDSETRN